jgi:hypothetical protein
VAFGRRDQEGAKLIGSDKIHVADHFMRRKGLVPIDLAGLGLREELGQAEQKPADYQMKSHSEGSVSNLMSI